MSWQIAKVGIQLYPLSRRGIQWLLPLFPAPLPLSIVLLPCSIYFPSHFSFAYGITSPLSSFSAHLLTKTHCGKKIYYAPVSVPSLCSPDVSTHLINLYNIISVAINGSGFQLFKILPRWPFSVPSISPSFFLRKTYLD